MTKKAFRRCAAVISACTLLASAVPAVPASAADNIITNSTFESGTSGWGTYKETGGKCTLTTEDDKLALKIASVGEKNYSVQVNYDIVPLYKNAVYRLKYDISCTIDRVAEGMIQQNGGTYQAYTWKKLTLSPEPLTMDYEFTMEEETDIMAKLVFNCGTYGEDLPEHTIYIDNVSLELIDDSQVDYNADKPYAPSINIDQVGYRTESSKIAVFRDVTDQKKFSVVNADTKEAVFTGDLSEAIENASAKETNYTGDFSSVKEPGKYYISCEGLDDSYTFTIGDDVYSSLMDDTVRMLYLQRCGVAIEDEVFSHVACHTEKATIYGTTEKIDVSGGWHDAGDYGRYVVPGAKTVADLLYAFQAAPQMFGDNTGIPESGNKIPDVLDEARFELEWMKKMQAENGGVYHKVSCATFPAYVMPEDEKDALIVTPVSSTATADFCASMALAYEFYKPYDKEFAEDCLKCAEKAWNWLSENPGFVFKNPEDIVTGDYGDKSDKDERYWATIQMYRATGDEKYFESLSSTGGAPTGLDWSTVGDYGNIALLTYDKVDKSNSTYVKALSAIKDQADSLLKVASASPYGSCLKKYNWGSNMTIANAGIILSLAEKLTGDTKYAAGAELQLNYLLGVNPLGTCFVSGYGTVSPQHPHHRPSMVKEQAMKGMLAGGVNQNLEDSAAKAYCISEPAAKCYVDNSESYSTNEITIYWNSPLTYLLALTEPSINSEPSTEPATEPETQPGTTNPTAALYPAVNGTLRLLAGNKSEHTVQNCTSVSASSSDESIVKVTVGGNIVSIEGIKEGQATVTIVADSKEIIIPVEIADAVSMEYFFGDANNDKKITVADAVAILQYTANQEKYPLDAICLIQADVDGEIGITGSDAIVIQRVDAGIIDRKSLPLSK